MKIDHYKIIYGDKKKEEGGGGGGGSNIDDGFFTQEPIMTRHSPFQNA